MAHFLIANPGRSRKRWLPAGMFGGFAPLEDASAVPPTLKTMWLIDSLKLVVPGRDAGKLAQPA
jgi:hypothetical protein